MRARPKRGKPFEAIFDDFERVLVPALTHWNSIPGSLAYFPATTSALRVGTGGISVGALNQNAMLWRTSPRQPSSKKCRSGWLRALLGPPGRTSRAVIYDTASISSLHALAAARQAAVPHVREQGLAARYRPQANAHLLLRAGTLRQSTRRC
jgi:aromatic-L-amino-acid decarboxylase